MTLAGGGAPNDVNALSVELRVPLPVAVDQSGNIYVGSPDYHIYKIDQEGVLTVFAGNGVNGSSGDGGPATEASLYPAGLAVDSSGNVYIADDGGGPFGDNICGRIRKVTNGIITAVTAVAPQSCFSGDGGPAADAGVYAPNGIAIDANNNIYIADEGNGRIREILNSTGFIYTIAGSGPSGSPGTGDGGLATEAGIGEVNGVAVDSSGNVYIAEGIVGETGFPDGNSRVRKVTPASPPGTIGIITTYAGGGSVLGNGGPATSAQLQDPFGVTFDANGNLFIADGGDNRIREVLKSNGIISTIAGTGVAGFTGDGGAAASAEIDSPSDVTFDASGNLYISDTSNNRVRRISNGIIQTVAGNGQSTGFGDGGVATSAEVQPFSVAVDQFENVYVAENAVGNFGTVREISQGVITTIAGNGMEGDSGDGGPATSAMFDFLVAVAVDPSGNVYVSDFNNGEVRKISNGGISLFAGSGEGLGEGGPAVDADVQANALAVDENGNLLISDNVYRRIRKVSNGIITTLAGNGTGSECGAFTPDGTPALSAAICPGPLAVDSSNNIYMVDHDRIREISNGVITTVAGNGVQGYSGDGGPATSAEFLDPSGVAVDASGNIYISDTNAIRKLSNGIITTIAGGATAGFSGDGGPAADALLSDVTGLAVDSSGNVYIADSRNNRIRVALAPPPNPTLPPNLLSLIPSSAPVGSPSLNVTITGTGFANGNKALFNGSPIPTTFVSTTQLIVTISAALLNSAGSSTVSVNDSNLLTFIAVAPVINSLSPTSTGVGSSFTLTVTGAHFVNGSTVHFNGTALATTFVNSTQVTAVVPASLVGVSGTAVVTVFNVNTASNEFAFSIGPPPITCVLNAGVPPVVRFEGESELLGNFIFNCTGGIQGQQLTTNITVFGDIPLTSRILNSSNNASEVLLLVNEPPPAQQVLNQNVFQATAQSTALSSSFVFQGIPITAPGPDGILVLRIVNLRADAHAAISGTSTAPQTALVAVQATQLTVVNGVLVLGFVYPTSFQNLGVNSADGQTTVQASFAEEFASAFKTQVAPGGIQSTPGVVYNTESGFVNPSLVPGAGLADSGTRLMLQLEGIPNGVNVYASVSQTSVLPAGDIATAQLTATDSNGAGPFTPIGGSSMFGGTYAQIPVSNNGAMAVWEITADDPDQLETLNFQVVLTGMTQPGLGPISTFGSLAPLNSSTTPATAADAPLPRFAPDSVTDFVDMVLLSNGVSNSSAQIARASIRPSPKDLPSAVQLRLTPKDSSGAVQVGGNTSLGFNLLNQGPGPASQVTASSNLPSTLSLIADSCQVSAGGSCSASTVVDNTQTLCGTSTCTNITATYSGPLQAGDAPPFSFNVEPSASATIGSTGTVTTVVTSNKTDPNPANNTISTNFVIGASVTTVSVTPSMGAGASQTFAFSFNDTAGASDIQAVGIVINTSFSAINGCFLYFANGSNLLYLLTNSGSVPPGMVIGSSGTLSNSQCSVNVGSSSVTLSGDTLTLHLALTFTSGFAGLNSVYMYAQNAALNSGFNLNGTFAATSAAACSIGVYRGGAWYVDSNHDFQYDAGDSSYAFGLGLTGASPVIGPWHTSAPSWLGVYDSAKWYVDTNGTGAYTSGDQTYSFGFPGAYPVVGDWTHSGVLRIGAFLNGVWYVDSNNDHVFDTGDQILSYGIDGDYPVLGDWDNTGVGRSACIGAMASG